MIKFGFQNTEIILNYPWGPINHLIKGRQDDQSEKDLKMDAQVRQELGF